MIHDNQAEIELGIPNRTGRFMAITDEYIMQPYSFYAEPRWKADGITDNRKEWRKKMVKHIAKKVVSDVIWEALRQYLYENKVCINAKNSPE